MRIRATVLLVLVVACVPAVGCSGSDAPEEEPGLDRIDGPAQVDPSYDPFAVDPTIAP